MAFAAAVPAPATDWRALYDEHWSWVYATVRRMGAVDVEDAVQDVFLVVVERLASFEGRSSLRTWLYRICFHIVSEQRRRAARHRRIARAVAWVAPWRRRPATGEQNAATNQDLVRLHRYLERMSEEKRAVFVLREIEQLSGDEVAEILSIPTATVRTRLFHARRELSRMMERESERRAP